MGASITGTRGGYSFSIIYLFIYLAWLHQVLVAAHGIIVAVCGIFSCGMWDL